jgi:hypothetical protein
MVSPLFWTLLLYCRLGAKAGQFNIPANLLLYCLLGTKAGQFSITADLKWALNLSESFTLLLDPP